MFQIIQIKSKNKHSANNLYIPTKKNDSEEDFFSNIIFFKFLLKKIFPFIQIDISLHRFSKKARSFIG
jgi:hypothetical protein